MKKIIESKYGLLIFSLLSGLSYFALIMILISGVNFSYLLGIFFFPAIVCGAALCIFKTVKNCIEDGRESAAKRMISINIAVIIFALISICTVLLL